MSTSYWPLSTGFILELSHCKGGHSGGHTGINQQNHQPVIGIVALIGPDVEIVLAVGDSAQFVGADIDLMNRAAPKYDDEVAKAVHHPDCIFRRQGRQPLREKLAQSIPSWLIR
ncbi:hypothetical protein [Asticcacaulis solisilvae]|uniref:hypothetical protein n=1 Tax=Asticcacaulis solisilvae TaxID=1217274 RepID=UPI003FD70B44